MIHYELIKTTRHAYTAVFMLDPEDGGFVVTFPAIPHLATQGQTLDEARVMAAECLQGHVEALQAARLPIPPGDERTMIIELIEEIRTRDERIVGSLIHLISELVHEIRDPYPDTSTRLRNLLDKLSDIEGEIISSGRDLDKMTDRTRQSLGSS